MDDREHRHLRALGASIRAEANDIKRTPEVVAREIGYDQELVARVFAGTASHDDAERLARAFCAYYPVAWRDLAIDRDQTDGGVAVMAPEASAATARVFDRPLPGGGSSAYYEYRDTAMTRGAPFRPEWIRPLRIIPAPVADSPEVVFNKGHLLHQFTFFIGEVTLYWSVNGERHACALDTGDSCYITPFVPHSFASRRADRPGLIIAVTYGGALKYALRDAASATPDLTESLAGSLETDRSAFASRVNRCLRAESMDLDALVKRVLAVAVRHERTPPAPSRLREVVGEGSPPTTEEVEMLAAALNVPASALTLGGLPTADSVVVRRAAAAPGWAIPGLSGGNGYEIIELVRTQRQTSLKALVIRPTCHISDSSPIVHALHEYVFNIGEDAVVLGWDRPDGGRGTAVLDPGASAYVRPLVRHGFGRHWTDDATSTETVVPSLSGSWPVAGGSSLLVVRVPGLLSDAALDEFAMSGPARARALHETERWF